MEIILTSIIAFASTNIDDIFILTLFFGDREFKAKEIFAGQFLGIISLVTISLIGSLVGLFIGQSYIGLLGLIPLYLGLSGIWKLIKNSKESDKLQLPDNASSKNNVLVVAGVTIANGGDNIGIYIPLFATLTWTNKITMIAVFFVMTLLWCMAAKYFTRHPYVARIVDKYGHLITPFVLLLLGIYILYESNTLELFGK